MSSTTDSNDLAIAPDATTEKVAEEAPEKASENVEEASEETPAAVSKEANEEEEIAIDPSDIIIDPSDFMIESPEVAIEPPESADALDLLLGSHDLSGSEPRFEMPEIDNEHEIVIDPPEMFTNTSRPSFQFNLDIGAALAKSFRRHIAFAVLLLVVSVVVWSLVRSGDPLGAVTDETTPGQGMSAFLKIHENMVVEPDQVHFFYDPIQRRWTDSLGYVPAFVLARQASQDGQEGVEDLYYLEARLSSSGLPLEIRRLSNLTTTPYASERLLLREGARALFSMDVHGQSQSLLLVDFSKDERELPEFESKFDKFRYRTTNLQEVGRWDGVGLRLYTLDPPVSEVSAVYKDGSFNIGLKGSSKDGSDTTETKLLIEPKLGSVVGVTDGADKRLVYQRRFFAAKDKVPWLVDTVRNHPLVGPRKIALLERFVFYWKDRLKGAAFASGFIAEEGELMSELGNGTAAATTEGDKAGPALNIKMSNDPDGEWPPPSVKSAIEEPKPGEGEWTATEIPWLRKLPGAPPAFMKTAVRVDPKRPYDHLVLIAMDMRQLDMGMVAGTVTPESNFGTPGKGTIPRTEKVINRLVGAFNGGFKTAHGAFGMQVDHKTILPSMPNIATIAVRDDGHVQMGTWNNSMNVPKNIRSLRQNLPPLVADGKWNPTGKRTRWGGTASDLDNINTTRSGVCFRGKSTLIYAWGKETSADNIGAAMLAAGCEYGMHLDMNPTHTGFSYYRAELENANKRGRIETYEVQKGSPSMAFREGRYVNRDVKDFFYLTLRETFEARLPEPPSGFGAWSSKYASTGPEGFLPLAAVSKGDAGTLVAMDMKRLQAKVRQGDREPSPTKGIGAETNLEKSALVLDGPAVLFDLGLTRLEGATGFISEGRIIAPIPPGLPALVRDREGQFTVLSPDQLRDAGTGAYTHVRGGRALVLGGEVASTEQAGSGAVQGLGVDGEGRLYYILLESGTAKEAATALKTLGVKTAMELPESPRADDTRMRFMRLEDNDVREVDPASGVSSIGADNRAHTTHLYLERLSEGPRVSRLGLEEVKLSEEETRRQRRLQYLIRAMRQELRQVENTKYKDQNE